MKTTVKAYEKDGSYYVKVLGDEVEVDSAGMVYPEGHSDEVIAIFDAIDSIEFPNGDVIS